MAWLGALLVPAYQLIYDQGLPLELLRPLAMLWVMAKGLVISRDRIVDGRLGTTGIPGRFREGLDLIGLHLKHRFVEVRVERLPKGVDSSETFSIEELPQLGVAQFRARVSGLRIYGRKPSVFLVC